MRQRGVAFTSHSPVLQTARRLRIGEASDARSSTVAFVSCSLDRRRLPIAFERRRSR
jgi:hypothetical protein